MYSEHTCAKYIYRVNIEYVYICIGGIGSRIYIYIYILANSFAVHTFGTVVHATATATSMSSCFVVCRVSQRRDNSCSPQEGAPQDNRQGNRIAV